MSTSRVRKKSRQLRLLWAFVRLVFALLLASMVGAYISNQVTINAKRAELDALNQQISQQQADNEEMQRILSGDPDEVTEWIARDAYGYAAPNERVFYDISGN